VTYGRPYECGILPHFASRPLSTTLDMYPMSSETQKITAKFLRPDKSGLSMTAATGGVTKKQARQFPFSNFQFLLFMLQAVRE